MVINTTIFENNTMISNWSKTLLVALALVLIYVIFLIFSDVDKIISSLTNINKTYLLFAGACWAITALLRVFRWHFFLKKITDRIKFSDSALYFLSGYAFILSPARMGEVIRSPLIERDFGVPITKTAPFVVIERFYDLLSITILIGIGLVFTEFEKSIILLPLGVLIVIFIIFRNKKLLTAILKKVSKLRIAKKMILNTEESLDVILEFTAKKFFLIGTLTSLVVGLFEAGSIYFLIMGLDYHTSFTDLIVIFHTSNFAAGASTIPGGIGVMEGGLMGLLILDQIKYEDAFSVAILIRLLSTGMFSIIGLVCFRLVSRKKVN